MQIPRLWSSGNDHGQIQRNMLMISKSNVKMPLDVHVNPCSDEEFWPKTVDISAGST